MTLSAAGVMFGEQFVNDGGGPSDDSSGSDVAFVLESGDGSSYRAVVPRETLGTFPSADRAFEAIFDELNSGSVYTGNGTYRLGSQLTVPSEFRVSNLPGGRFVNDLSDPTTKCLKFTANTGSDYLKVDCARQDGVLLGEKNTGSDIDVWYADVHRAGLESDSQAALKIQGSGIKLYHVNIYRGTKGIHLEGAYDVHVLSAIVTNSDIGLRIDGGVHCFFDQMDFDSCRGYAARIDDASAIELEGLVWNNPEFDAWPYRGVEIGVNQPCDNVFTDVKQLSNPGTALYVDKVEASHLHHDVNQADQPQYEYDAAIATTSNTAASCVIEGYVSPSISNALTDLSGGTFQLTGAGTDSGTYETGGTGSKQTFEIPHQLGTQPDRTRVQPRSAAAAGNFYVADVSASAITVTYTSPPPRGTGNLVWHFEASV